MPSKRQSATRQGGGLTALKEHLDVLQCETPNRPYLKASDNAKKIVYIIRPDCKLWSCRACAERRRRIWVFYANYGGDALLAQGSRLSFVTLTSHRLVRSLSSGIIVWRSAWPKLSARWRRAEKNLQYLYIPEHVRGSNFHIHLITTATLPTRWYKDNAAATGLGYEAKAVAILEARWCGGYVGKYLGKALSNMAYPKYFRRVNTSQGWPRPKEPETPYEWQMLGSKPQKVIFLMEVAREEGWEVEHSLKELDWRQ